MYYINRLFCYYKLDSLKKEQKYIKLDNSLDKYKPYPLFKYTPIINRNLFNIHNSLLLSNGDQSDNVDIEQSYNPIIITSFGLGVCICVGAGIYSITKYLGR
jgi:hypothetical protein